MKKSKFTITITTILIIFILLGVISAGVDYFRMKSGSVPVFNLKNYDATTKIQTFRGIFYKAKRKITASENESLVDSSEIEFLILIFNLNVPKQFKEIDQPYNIEIKETASCHEKSKLYYADKDIKVYTYCLDSISIKKNNKSKELINYLKKDTDILNDIDSKLTYLGLYEDQATMMFKSTDNFATNGLTMYRCHEKYMTDVYLAPANAKFQNDFCTYKEDDFKFLWELKEEPKVETPNTPPVEQKKEVIFEDEVYRYEFDEEKSNRIFVIMPAVRGASEIRYPLRQVIQNKMLSMDELAAKGLKFNKIDKKKEQEELLKKKALEEAKKKAELEAQQNNISENNQ